MRLGKTFLLILLLFLVINCSSGNKGTPNVGIVKPGSAEYIFREGLAALNRGELDFAEKKLLQAIQKNSALIDAHNALGITYLYKKNYQQALTYFNNVIKLNPTYYDAYNSLGLVYLAIGDRAKAKESFLTAANALSYPTRENCYVNLAIMELEDNNLEDAKRYVFKGLEVKKDFAPLYNLLGLIYERENLLEESLEAFKKAVNYSRIQQADYFLNLGRAYHKNGRRNEALDALERALALVSSLEEREAVLELIREVQKN